ncbi:hypothetical protein BH23PLA1_BH23PLA1_30350 [soil metagenome]
MAELTAGNEVPEIAGEAIRSPKARLANRLAGIITFVYVVIGYLSQLSLVLTRQSAAGLSPVFLLLGLAAFSSWVVSGWMAPRNYAIVVPNALGLCGSLALLVLYFLLP